MQVLLGGHVFFSYIADIGGGGARWSERSWIRDRVDWYRCVPWNRGTPWRTGCV